jgi:uncharacterized protein
VVGPETARTFLESEDVDGEIINHVIKIIENISYKGGNFFEIFASELDIVQDADRLDSWSHRNCSDVYGGFKNRALRP